MNPFENSNNTDTINNNIIEIWVETNGRRKNTYISGLSYTKKEMKEHLSNLKKKHGCNGSIKDLTEIKDVLHLQGDHIYNIISYFEQHNITNIIVKSM
jgi:translation initiation factor 1 (eIF-1/SUI1)